MSLDEINNKPEINISKDDENFIEKFLIDFYYKIIETNDFNNFEKISSEWIKYELDSNDKNSENILELMENHKESKFWFTSFIGFFYQFGISCNLDKKKALEFYLLAIDNEVEKDFLDEDFNKLHLFEKNENTFNLLKSRNIIIGKYLLSLFYYKDIILDIIYKQNKFISLQKLAKNGDLEAQYNLAVCYKNGSGVK